MAGIENGRTLAGVVAEVKDELKDFLQTRIDMLRSELRIKLSTWKTALPMLIAGLLFLLTAWAVLTGCLIALIGEAFAPNPFAYFFAFLIVGVAYALVGGACAFFAYRQITEESVVPQRTIKVLKDDAVWLQTEARSRI